MSIKFYGIGQVPPDCERQLTLYKQSLDNLEHNINSTIEFLNTLGSNENFELLIEKLKAAKNISSTNRKTFIEDAKRHQSHRRSVENQLASLRQEYSQTIKTIQELEAQLANIQTEESLPEISDDLLKKALKSSKHLTGNPTVSVHDTRGTVATNVWLSWKLRHLKMSPNINPYKNINMGKAVTLNLPTIHVGMNPCTAAVQISCERPIPTPFAGSSGQAHPHIMRDNAPCFGDYEQAIFSCIEKQDITAFNEVLEIFLQQSTHEDGAGVNWPYWLPREQLSWLARRNDCLRIGEILYAQPIHCVEYIDGAWVNYIGYYLHNRASEYLTQEQALMLMELAGLKGQNLYTLLKLSDTRIIPMAHDTANEFFQPRGI